MQSTVSSSHNLTKEQLILGLNKIKEWYPEEAAMIDQYQSTIISYVIDGVDIPNDHPIWEEQHVTKTKEIRLEGINLNNCQRGIIEFSVESITFLFTVAGFLTAGRLNKFIDRYITSIFFEVPEYEKEIQPLLDALNEAEGSLSKAKAFIPVAKNMWGYGILRGCFDVIKGNSTWAEWVLNGSVAVTQLIVWAGSEFIAAIAEIAGVILGAVHLLLSGRDAMRACR